MTYLETNLLAQDYYYKIINVKDGKYKDLYKSNYKAYESNYAALVRIFGHVNGVDSDIEKTKNLLNYYLKDYLKNGFDGTVGYNESDFVIQMAHLDALENFKAKQEQEQRQEQEREQKFEQEQEQKRKEEDTIKKTYGEYDTVHRKPFKKLGITSVKITPKSSEELINERDERLAILYKLKRNNKLDEKEFVKNVVSVRRVYDRDIQSKLVVEAQNLDVKNKSNLQKLKQLLKNIKNVFKLGKPISNIENEVGKPTTNKEFASLALAEVGSILFDSDNEKKVAEAIDCLKDANSIKASIPDIKLSAETNKIVDDFYKEKLLIADKTAHKDIYRNKDGSYRVERTEEQNAEIKKDWITRARFSFSSALNKFNETKTKQQVQDNETDMLNYMIKNYKHTRKVSGSFNDGIQVEYIFEDAKVQKSYLELQSMFKYQKSMIDLNTQADKELETKSNDVATNLEQNAGATV